jgi:hypothetical protein
MAVERSEPVRDGPACALPWVDGFHGAARSIRVTGAASQAKSGTGHMVAPLLRFRENKCLGPRYPSGVVPHML